MKDLEKITIEELAHADEFVQALRKVINRADNLRANEMAKRDAYDRLRERGLLEDVEELRDVFLRVVNKEQKGMSAAERQMVLNIAANAWELVKKENNKGPEQATR